MVSFYCWTMRPRISAGHRASNPNLGRLEAPRDSCEVYHRSMELFKGIKHGQLQNPHDSIRKQQLSIDFPSFKQREYPSPPQLRPSPRPRHFLRPWGKSTAFCRWLDANLWAKAWKLWDPTTSINVNGWFSKWLGAIKPTVVTNYNIVTYIYYMYIYIYYVYIYIYILV